MQKVLAKIRFRRYTLGMTKRFLCNFSDSAEFTTGKIYNSREDFANKNLVTSNNGMAFFIPTSRLLLLGYRKSVRFEELK
jgi:hypothetical protein